MYRGLELQIAMRVLITYNVAALCFFQKFNRLYRALADKRFDLAMAKVSDTSECFCEHDNLVAYVLIYFKS
jgi:hypothetical protein